jgi:hypothetical protein
MSRIHEALKKAEQDRSASRADRKLEEPSALIEVRQPVQVATNGGVVLAPTAVLAPTVSPAPALSPVPTVSPVPVSPISKTHADSENLQLDELRAKCVKTTWKLDPNFLVFSGPKETL